MITQIQKEKIVNLLKLYKCFGMQYIEPITFNNSAIQANKVLPSSYDKLSEHIEHCNLCELSKCCNKNIGLNSSKSDIYIVGLHCNFSDRTILEHLQYFFCDIFGLDFKEVYMTNIIKCETNNEIAVNYEMIALTCQEYFLQELLIEKPKYIFATVGACRYILRTNIKSSDIVGKSFKVDESILFPIYDLKFISQNPSYKEEMERVLKKIKGLIH